MFPKQTKEKFNKSIDFWVRRTLKVQIAILTMFWFVTVMAVQMKLAFANGILYVKFDFGILDRNYSQKNLLYSKTTFWVC